MAAEKIKQVIDTVESALTSASEERTAIDKVVRGLKQLFDRASDNYKSSTDFDTSLDKLLESLNHFQSSANATANPIYVLIRPLIDDLKLHRASATKPKNAASAGANVGASTAEDEPSSSNGHAASTGSARQRQLRNITIIKARKELERMRKEIKVAETEEIPLEDIDKEDNAYSQMLRLKQKYIQLQHKLAALEKRELSLLEPVPIWYKGSGYDSIDKSITKLIRWKPKAAAASELRVYGPPNYADILQTIRKTNEASNLALTDDAMTDLAKLVGGEVIELIKKRTLQELQEYWNDAIETAAADEHTSADPALEAILTKNLEIAVSKGGQYLQSVQHPDGEADDGLAEAEPEEADECRESEEETDDDDSDSSESKSDKGEVEISVAPAQHNDGNGDAAGNMVSIEAHQENADDNIFAIMAARDEYGKRKAVDDKNSASKRAKTIEPDIIELSDDE